MKDNTFENININHKEHVKVNAAYILKHKATDKIYVGSTCNLYMRVKRHLNDLENGNSSNVFLQTAFNTDKEIELSACKTKSREEAFKIEQELLDINRSTGNLFNIAIDAKISTKGRSISPEHKEAFRKANTGRPMSPELKEKLLQLNIGKVVSEETRAKLSVYRKGKPRPKEELNNFIETRRNNSKPVEINGVEYRSIPDAADNLGLTYHQVYNRCHQLVNGFTDWKLI
jgi:group I intron endonuclease